MPNTPNHEYNVPNQGDSDWHVPLNENFEDYDTDIELRDADANKSNYDPKQGAKFLATDTGVVYTGDGSDWVPSFAVGEYTDSTNSAYAGSVVVNPALNDLQNDPDGAVIAGGGRDDSQAPTGPYPNVVTHDFGTIGGGWNNEADRRATVAGGTNNKATSSNATVAGGSANEATGSISAILGGQNHVASGRASVIGGGTDNEAAAYGATIGGGRKNLVRADYGTIAGGGYQNAGTGNLVTDEHGAIGGGSENQAGDDDGDPTTATHATVSGGKGNTASSQGTTVAGGQNNTASGTGAAVSGGSENDATDINSTVVGGRENEASGQHATVGGGRVNTASGHQSMIPGGANNVASGTYGFAAGVGAGAINDNAFVWHTGQNYHNIPGTSPDGLSSAEAVNGEPVTGADTFNVGAPGGVRFVTGSSSVTYIASGSTGWANTSTRTAKTNISPVEPEQALDGVDSLEVATWEYTDEDGEGAGTTHIGPMAEEFHDAFDVGDSDEHINSINADGVALAAIQGLSAKVDERDDQIEDLEATVDEQREEIDALRAELDALRDQLTS